MENIYIGEIRFNPEMDCISELRRQLKDALRINTHFYGEAENLKIDVDFLYSRKEMNDFYGKETADWLVGNGSGNKITIFSEKVFDMVSCHPKSDFFPVLVHEISHIFSREIFGNYGGYFISEGICGFVAKQYETRKVSFSSDFEKLYDSRWNDDPNYNQAYHFIKYLIDKYGKEKLFELLLKNDYKNDFIAFKSIFSDIFRIKFEDIEIEWKKSIS